MNPLTANSTAIRLPRFVAVGATAGILTTGLAAAPATAASSVPEVATPTPFTIHEVVMFGAADDPTFTAEGPICSSGTFHDDFSHVTAWQGSASKLFLMGTTVYTCDDGSGTILARKKVFITFNPDGSMSNSGPFEITGGTGDYQGLRGAGTDIGTAPVNPATGTVDVGTGTITGTIVP